MKGNKINLANVSEKKRFRFRIFCTGYLNMSGTSYLSRFIMKNSPLGKENCKGGEKMNVVLEL